MSAPVEIRAARPEDVPRLVEMWGKLYAHQGERGMLLPLAQNAAEAWGASIVDRLDSPIARVVVADDGETVQGFLTCQVKRLPPMYDAPVRKGGAMLEMWVEEEFRSGGVGRRLAEGAVEWFRSADATSVEFQVVVGNEGGLRFWERMGWTVECYQMRRML